MPSTYTVTAVSPDTRDFDSQYGPKRSYRLHLRNGDGSEHLNVEMVRNANGPAPTVGETYEGDLEDRGQYGQRLKLANRGGSGGVYAGSRPEDPKRAAAIQRMHSQSAAVALIHAKAAAGFATEDDFKSEKVRQLADWFDADTQRARTAA